MSILLGKFHQYSYGFIAKRDKQVAKCAIYLKKVANISKKREFSHFINGCAIETEAVKITA